MKTKTNDRTMLPHKRKLIETFLKETKSFCNRGTLLIKKIENGNNIDEHEELLQELYSMFEAKS
jgi:hypothetical protein